MEPPLAQILVVVANIRMRSWMTEVEEGFVSTAVEHELANPKLYGYALYDMYLGGYTQFVSVLFCFTTTISLHSRINCSVVFM